MQKRGGDRLYYPWAILGTFWQFGGFTVKTVSDWSPRVCKPAEKAVHHPTWVISWALPRVYLGPGHAGSAKYTLGRAPTKGGVPFSLLACILWETSLAHRFHWKSPKSPKSAQKGPRGSIGGPPLPPSCARIFFFGVRVGPPKVGFF